MTDYAAAQHDEIEALQSIYLDEFEDKGGSPASFQIRLHPGADGGTVWVSVILKVTFTSKYPVEELPIFELIDTQGIDNKQQKELLHLTTTIAEQNLGMPLVYTVAEAIREWLTENNVKPSDGSAFDEMMRRKAGKDIPKSSSSSAALSREADPSILRKTVITDTEENETVRRKRDGTPVTREAFLAWRTKFDAEMEIKAKDDEAKGLDIMIGYGKKFTGKLTGKQLFDADSTLSTSDNTIVGNEDDGNTADVDYSVRGANKSNRTTGASNTGNTSNVASSSSSSSNGTTIIFDTSAFEGDEELPSDDESEYVPGESDEDDDDDDFDDEDDDDDDDDD